MIRNSLKCVGCWGSAPDPAGGAYDAPPDPLVRRGFAPSALATRYFLSPHILLAQMYPPNSTFLESPMVLSNPQTPPLDTLCLVSGPSGPQLYEPPYLFLGNSTTGVHLHVDLFIRGDVRRKCPGKIAGYLGDG